jgi:hypothetical protein
MAGHQTDSDRLAQMLAAKAGVDWERLGDYPGYSKYYWREQAQAIHAALADTALADNAAPEQPAAIR